MRKGPFGICDEGSLVRVLVCSLHQESLDMSCRKYWWTGKVPRVRMQICKWILAFFVCMWQRTFSWFVEHYFLRMFFVMIIIWVVKPIYVEWTLIQLFRLVGFQQQGVWLVFIKLCLIEIPVFYANSVDPEQMLHPAAASDLGLHCLPVTLLGVSRLKWVNTLSWFFFFFFFFILVYFVKILHLKSCWQKKKVLKYFQQALSVLLSCLDPSRKHAYIILSPLYPNFI